MASKTPKSSGLGLQHQGGPRRHQKRIQVARACDGCRLRRSKCDNGVPCSNCIARGYKCSNSGISHASTLTEASEEIARLRQRVQQLEIELNSQNHKCHNSPMPISSPSVPHQTFSALGNVSGSASLKKYCGGIQFRPTRSSNDAWFGPSSLYSFIQRLGEFLNLKLHETQSIHGLHPISPSNHNLLDMPETGLDRNATRPWVPPAREAPTSAVYLTLVQEEYFINLFWQTYHTSLFPIVDEAQFKRHYQSLWVNGGQDRKPSALVDIVIAMCMQYATSTMPVETQGILVEGKDALVAGRWHFWRGQKLLKYELDSPSLSTLQCHLLCAVYICGGSFHNMMDSTVGLAVRTAYILGLHLDPPSTMPEQDREIRRRLWWAVYLMDSKAGMKLGRPFLLQSSYAMPSLPSDNLEAAANSGSTFAPIGHNATWLSYNLHMVRLYTKVREAYTAFYDQGIHLQEDQTLWANHQAQNSSVEVLVAHTQGLHEWTDSVPVSLRLERENNGRPLSTDFSPISFEPFTPPWLQRQRLLLEHTYHHLSLNLYRPLISFSLKPLAGSISEEFATRCASHATMLTMITHQALTESSLLDGWHEAFYCQWNAVMTLVGFVLLFPYSTLLKKAKKAIDLAVLVFDNFGAKFSVAANASKIVRELSVKLEVFSKNNQLEPDSAIISYDFENNSSSSSWVSMDQTLYSHGLIDTPNFNLFEMATDIDFWNSLDTLWPDFDNPSQFESDK